MEDGGRWVREKNRMRLQTFVIHDCWQYSHKLEMKFSMFQKHRLTVGVKAHRFVGLFVVDAVLILRQNDVRLCWVEPVGGKDDVHAVIVAVSRRCQQWWSQGTWVRMTSVLCVICRSTYVSILRVWINVTLQCNSNAHLLSQQRAPVEINRCIPFSSWGATCRFRR